MDLEPQDIKTFLTSDRTREIIGKNHEYYLPRFEQMLERAGGKLPEPLARRSMWPYRNWNWPAALVPGLWLLYRRQYLLGIAVIVFMAVINWGPAPVPLLQVGALLSPTIYFGFFGNALYLRYVYRRWHGETSATANPATPTGVDVKAPLILAGLSAAAIAFLAFGGLPFGGVAVSCSTADSTELVKKIIRDELTKTGVVDGPRSTVNIENIRTQNSAARKVDCAASLAVTAAAVSGPGVDQDAAKYFSDSTGQAYSTDISYTVELTDDGSNIYVTVNRLGQ